MRSAARLFAPLLLVALLASGCVSRAHPGHTLVRRKCTVCHTEPPREKLKSVDIRVVMTRHRGKKRIKLNEDQIRQLERYIAEGDPR